MSQNIFKLQEDNGILILSNGINKVKKFERFKLWGKNYGPPPIGQTRARCVGFLKFKFNRVLDYNLTI